MDLKAFEGRHPFVRELLTALSADHLSQADKTAAKFEDLAAHIASVLPDGDLIEYALTLVQRAQQKVVSAIIEAEGGVTPAATVPSPQAPAQPVAAAAPVAAGAPALVPGKDHPITESAPVSMPGRDHPVTGPVDVLPPAAPIDVPPYVPGKISEPLPVEPQAPAESAAETTTDPADTDTQGDPDTAGDVDVPAPDAAPAVAFVAPVDRPDRTVDTEPATA